MAGAETRQRLLNSGRVPMDPPVTHLHDEPMAENGYNSGDSDVEEVVDGVYNKDVWDEGGRSDCGYSDQVHDIFMTIGETVYSMFGEPSEQLQKPMKGIGTFFQEASYAVRDFQRGRLALEPPLGGSVDGDVSEYLEQEYDSV